MPNLAARFTLILTGLRAAIGAFMSRRDHATVVWLGTQAYVPLQAPPAHAPIPPETWTLAHTRLGRMIARFTRLYARWQANTLTTPRPPRPGRPAPPPAPRLPTRQAWVVASVGHHAASFASQCQHLLAEPELAEFVAAAPQAGRILRPLCRMLGLTRPDVLRLPPRPPPRPKPRAAPPPPHPPARPLPAYVRATVRAWKRKFG